MVGVSAVEAAAEPAVEAVEAVGVAEVGVAAAAVVQEVRAVGPWPGPAQVLPVVVEGVEVVAATPLPRLAAPRMVDPWT